MTWRQKIVHFFMGCLPKLTRPGLAHLGPRWCRCALCDKLMIVHVSCGEDLEDLR